MGIVLSGPLSLSDDFESRRSSLPGGMFSVSQEDIPQIYRGSGLPPRLFAVAPVFELTGHRNGQRILQASLFGAFIIDAGTQNDWIARGHIQGKLPVMRGRDLINGAEADLFDRWEVARKAASERNLALRDQWEGEVRLHQLQGLTLTRAPLLARYADLARITPMRKHSDTPRISPL